MRNEFYWMPLQYDLTRIYVSWQGLIWQFNSSSAQNKIKDCLSDLNTFSVTVYLEEMVCVWFSGFFSTFENI